MFMVKKLVQRNFCDFRKLTPFLGAIALFSKPYMDLSSFYLFA